MKPSSIICTIISASLLLQQIALAAPKCEEPYAKLLQAKYLTPNGKSWEEDLVRTDDIVERNQRAFHHGIAEYFMKERGYENAQEAREKWSSHQSAMLYTDPEEKNYRALLKEADKIRKNMKADFPAYDFGSDKSQTAMKATTQKYGIGEAQYYELSKLLNANNSKIQRLVLQDIAYHLKKPSGHFSEAVFKAIDDIKSSPDYSYIKDPKKRAAARRADLVKTIVLVGAVVGSTAFIESGMYKDFFPQPIPIQTNAVLPKSTLSVYEKIERAINYNRDHSYSLSEHDAREQLFKDLINIVSNEKKMDLDTYIYLLSNIPSQKGNGVNIANDPLFPQTLLGNDPTLIIAVKGLDAVEGTTNYDAIKLMREILLNTIHDRMHEEDLAQAEKIYTHIADKILDLLEKN